MNEFLNCFLSNLSKYPEFWSAIAGALVGALTGGFIAYAVQYQALRGGREQRREYFKRSQQVLGNALIVKLIKIYSNLSTLYQYIEYSFKQGEQLGTKAQPWQFVKPIASFPDTVSFTSEELSMLMAMGNDEVFNSVLSMDIAHNVQLDNFKLYKTLRASVVEKLQADGVDETAIISELNQDQLKAFKPAMITANDVIEQVRDHVKRDFKNSEIALYGAYALLKDKLELSYELESTFPNQEAAP